MFGLHAVDLLFRYSSDMSFGGYYFGLFTCGLWFEVYGGVVCGLMGGFPVWLFGLGLLAFVDVLVGMLFMFICYLMV